MKWTNLGLYKVLSRINNRRKGNIIIFSDSKIYKKHMDLDCKTENLL